MPKFNINPPPEYNTLGVEGCFSWQDEAHFIWDALQISNPKNILETGFFKGASAYMFLAMSNANLTSIDPACHSYHPELPWDGSLENITKLQTLFPNRFEFIKKKSQDAHDDIKNKQFDLFFIDGDHWEAGIRHDFQLALDMKIPWVLVDDFVTSVLEVYLREFKDKFLQPVRIYPRKAQFQGQPIPIVLLKTIL